MIQLAFTSRAAARLAAAGLRTSARRELCFCREVHFTRRDGRQMCSVERVYRPRGVELVIEMAHVPHFSVEAELLAQMDRGLPLQRPGLSIVKRKLVPRHAVIDRGRGGLGQEVPIGVDRVEFAPSPRPLKRAEGLVIRPRGLKFDFEAPNVTLNIVLIKIPVRIK